MYSLKSFVSHTRQLAAIQRTRGSVPEETVTALKAQVVGNADIAKYLGVPNAAENAAELAAAVDKHLAGMGIRQQQWRSAVD